MQLHHRRKEQSLSFQEDNVAYLEPSKEALEQYSKQYRDAFSPDTLRQINQSQKQFQQWCDENGFSANPPVSPLHIAKYVEFLGGKVGVQTIKNRLWAIGELHKSVFLPSPCRHRLVTLTVRGVQRKYGNRVGQAPALCKAEVLAICKRLGNSPVDLRDKALLLTASDTWCRASELVAMKVKDLDIQEDGSATMHITKSKFDPYGRGEHAYVSARTVAAIQACIQGFDLTKDDVLFSRQRPLKSNLPITTTTVSKIFKKLTGRNEVSAHSTRVGGVHDALRLGCDLTQIMLAGRWASPEMPAVYGRKLMAGQSAAATVCRAFEDVPS